MYPPKPVSVAIKWPEQREYELLAWGHPEGNTCTEKWARGRLARAYNSRLPLLMQNGMFDLDVAEEHWELPLPDDDRWHDTMFLLALNNPHAPTFSLKPSAEMYLGIKPEEQDRMKDWIIENVPEAHRRPSEWGAYICKCPYQIVKPYHKGDLTRTQKLFQHLWPLVMDAGMGAAYRRELKLMPILLESARTGMKLDVNLLEQMIPEMRKGIELADKWLRKKLGIDNIDSDRQLGSAIHKKNMVTSITQTKQGHISVSKKFMTLDKFKPRYKDVWQALQYRNQMSTSLNMFALPWLELATASPDGRTLFPNWVQVRSSRLGAGGGDKTGGARSNRIISVKPNFLNIPKKWKRAISSGYVHPAFIGKLMQLPYMRTVCLPDRRQRWGKRDFNQQELRLFGHFEDGYVKDQFLTNPKFDIHEDVRAEAEARLIEAMLREAFDRDTAKSCVFGRVYGQGLTGLMDLLRLTESEKRVAQIIQRAINTAVPSIKELDEAIKEHAKEGNPICTWGGRLYYTEPPSYSEKYGRDMTYEYKLLNYLLQGSGADVTKETIIRWHSHPKRVGRLVVTVYDEIDFSSPASAMRQDQASLRECMLSIETDIPMLSDGEEGPNWGTLSKYKDTNLVAPRRLAA